MSMVIANNMQAVNTKRQFAASARGMSGSMEKLSSGYKINTGKDDPAGLVISEQLRSQLNGLKRAQQNTEEAINVMGIAEGALNEMNNILKKMKALAIHSANTGVTSPDQIAADQAEMDSAIQTLDRIASTTKFSDQNLLNGQKDITYEQTTATQGTQQNSLINARETAVNQIFKRDGSSIAMSFTGTTNANALTGTGDTDFSQQAMKAYMEIDTARGATMSQLDAQGKFTQEQSFTLTGSRGSRSFKFKQGTSVTELVKQVHASAGSTGVDAALVFNSAQRIDKLTDGNGEFAAQVENKFKMDGLVNEKGEGVYLTVTYDETNKDKVNLDAFKNGGLDFQITMNDDLDAYGMPTYSVSLGGSNLLTTWDGKADSFNSAMSDLIANNSDAGSEFAHLKYMNFTMDTDVSARESFKGTNLFEFATKTPLEATANTFTPTFDGADAPDVAELKVDFSGVDAALFLGGNATFKAEVKDGSDYLHLSAVVDGVEHTAQIALEEIYAVANASSTFVIGKDAGGQKRLDVGDSIFTGITIATGANTKAYVPGTHSVNADADKTVAATDTKVQFVAATPKPTVTTNLHANSLDNIPEEPTAMTKPTMPRQQVEKPVDPNTLPALVAPETVVDPRPVGGRPASIGSIAGALNASGLKDAAGADIAFNLIGASSDTATAQSQLDALRAAIGDKEVKIDFTANGDGSSPGNTTYNVKLTVGTGADAQTFQLNQYWSGAANSSLTYDADAAGDTSDLGKALANVRFSNTIAVDKAKTLDGKLDYNGMLGNVSISGVANASVSAGGVAANSKVEIDFSKMTHDDWNKFLTSDMKEELAKGGEIKVKASLDSTSTVNGTLNIELDINGKTQAFTAATVLGNGTSSVALQQGANTFSNIDITTSGLDQTNFEGNTATGIAVTTAGDAPTPKWLGGVKPTGSTGTMDKSDFAPIVSNIDLQKSYDEMDTYYKAAVAEYNLKKDQYDKDVVARAAMVAGYSDALAAYNADQARLAEEMKTYNADMKDYNIYREQVAKFEAGSNVVKNGKPVGTDIIPDPASVTGGVAIGTEAASVARNKGTAAIFNNEIAKDGSGNVERGVQGVSFSDDAAASIHYGKNTDGQGRIYVKFLDDNTFELYKDSSLSEQSKVASGINGQEIKEANNSGLKGLTLNLAKGSGDLTEVKGVYIALAGIEGRSTNTDKDGNSYDGVTYDKDVVNSARTVDAIATQEDVDAALAKDPASTLSVGDKFKKETFEGKSLFDADRTLITGVELGKNTSEDGKIYLKNIYDAEKGTVQVFAYKNEKMRDEDMVASSEVYKVRGDDGTDAESISVVLNEVRTKDKTAGTGLGLVFSVDAGAFKDAESATLTGSMTFNNLGARIFTEDYGSGATLKVTQDKGAIFTYYDSAGVESSKRLVAAGEKATTVELKGQDASVSVNGAEVKTDGLELKMANQDLQANFVFNKGKVGSTTMAQVGYDDGSIFTKVGALNYGGADMREDGISGQLNNAGHVTNETLDGFQGGMQLQLGDGEGDQNRTVVAIKSLTADNLGRVSKGGYWETGSAVYTERMFTMKDVMGGGLASLKTDAVLAMSIIEKSIADVTEVRAQIGAMQSNLLQTNSNNLSVTMENIQKTESGIRDADMADEMTEFTKNQVLQNAAMSMMSNANANAQNVLQLLR